MSESKGHVAEICANVVSVLAYQAPAGDKILSGEMWEVLDKLYGSPVPSEEGLENRAVS